MKHEDQIVFYTCPLCGMGTGNDIDGLEPHDCPEIANLKKCPTCLANFTGEHTCFPLMKELVKMKKEQIMWALIYEESGNIECVFYEKEDAENSILIGEAFRGKTSRIVKVKVTIL